MKNLTYVQEYFMCAVNEKGNISKLNGMGVTACLVVGEITELITRGYVIWDDKNMLSIIKPGDDDLTYLKPIYEAIAYFKQAVDVTYIVDMYASHMRLIGNYRKGSVKDLLVPIGESLGADACVDEIHSKGLPKSSMKYAPRPSIVENIIEGIREANMKDATVMNNILCLVALLDKSEMIHNYFSKEEIGLMKDKKHDIDESTQKLLDYIEMIPRILSGLDWGA